MAAWVVFSLNRIVRSVIQGFLKGVSFMNRHHFHANRFGRVLALCGVLASGIHAAPIITLPSLLAEMTDPAAIARWPEPEFSAFQSSSHDRRTISPDQPGWFANDDHTQYIRSETNEGRQEHVMMDADGPGCVVRFWLTTIDNKKGVLRVYLDGEKVPALVFPAYDLLAGNLGLTSPIAQPHPGYTATGNGGNTLILPISYARHCKVTWEEQGAGPRYYKIDYRTYDAGTAVETFTRPVLESAMPAVRDAARRLLSPRSEPAGKSSTLQRRLAPGAESSLELPPGPAAINFLELQLPPEKSHETPAEILRSTILRLEFDGEETVWCPVGDFFGSGTGLNELRSWSRTVQPDGTMVCRWVMPYQKSARITVLNTGKEAVDFKLRDGTQPWQWDDRSMHFHSAWHYEADRRTPPARDWNFVSLKGRGVYVGDTLSLFNQVATWYGEGDEKIRIDGEKIPSQIGTGTEDYYNYSFAPRGIIQTPFANQIRVDEPRTQGHNILTRSRALDGIPYRQSLDFDIELISWAPTRMIYAATTHWYAFPSGKSNIAPDVDGANAVIPTLADAQKPPAAFPGVIDAERLTLLSKSAGLVTETQDMEPYGIGLWSRGAQLLGRAALGSFVELKIPAIDGEQRELHMTATQAPDFGILSFTVNGQTVSKPFDGYAPAVTHTHEISLGAFTPIHGQFTVRIDVTGTNSATTGPRYFFGIDGFRLTPLNPP